MKLFQSKQTRETRDRIHANVLTYCASLAKGSDQNFKEYISILKKELEMDDQ
jgi:hypothetical protein